MPGLSFLSKKSWHTSNLDNQERVWLAEQKAASEAQKTKELQDQIKAEREREEFDKLAKKQTIGDRGTNWMYEGHGVSGQDELQSAAAAASEAKVEEVKNESYLLGKEYVPDSQTGKGSGDFATVNNMTGALEKASTVGATIGAGQSTTTSNVAAAVGGGEGSTLRIQQTSTTQATDNNNSEWNQNFHLRHEDPMFAVSQQKKAIDKDVEKKRKLMERAGLDVRPVLKNDGLDSGSEDRKMRGGEDSEDGDKRRHKKKKKRKHKSKRKSHHKSSSKRRRRDRSRSPSYSSDYSSSSSVSSRGRRHRDSRKHRGDRYESKHRRSRSRSADRNHSRGDDRRRHHSHRRSRSRSYSPRDRRRRHSSRSYSRSKSRDNSRNRREYDSDRKKRGRDEPQERNYNGHNNHDDRKPPPSATSSSDYQRAKDDNTNSPKKKVEGYGLIGTSLADRNNASSQQQQQKHDYLGPNQKLLAAKRDEIEQERRLRLEAAGRGGGGDYDEFGRSRPRSKEERERALKEMERTARDRR